MKIIKRLIAFFVLGVILISGLGTVYAETVTFEKVASVDISGSAYLTCTSDRYLFAAVGDSAKLAYEIKIYDKETLKYLTSITAQSPAYIYLNVNAMHVKGDFLYVAFVQRNAGNGNEGNPLVKKYNIKEIYENKVMTADITTGMRPKAYTYIDDDVLCRTDSGYRNITFMNLETLSDKSAIGISEENADLLKNYTKLYVGNNLLYAVYGKNIYVYDASFAISGTSKQDELVYKGSFAPGKTSVTELKAVDNYLYCGTTEGIYIINMENPETPVNLGLIANTGGTKNIEINNDFMYTSRSALLEVYDISNRTEPKLIHSLSASSEITSIHLRPGKVYLGQSKQISVYNTVGLDIEETTVPGTVDKVGDITFNKKLNLSEKAEGICSYKDYVFILNSDKNEISVYDKQGENIIAKISKEENASKLLINDMYCSNGYLYVSYDSVFRKYMISDSKSKDFLSESMAVPMFSEANDVSIHISQTDKYIFVATSNLKDRSLLANGKILVFDKKTNEYLTSIHIDTGNNNYDMAVRNMWTAGDKLYVTYNNAKTATNYAGSLSGVMPDYSRTHSPLVRYDVANIDKNQTLSCKIITSNSEIQNLSHPYDRGGNSYYDENEKVLYQGKYTKDSGQCYNVYDLSAGEASLKVTLKNGSYDSVKFSAGNGYLYEVLQNNGGLSVSGTTQEYNKVRIYDITNPQNAEIDLSQRLKGTYQTTVYGSIVINDVAADRNRIYVATTSGIEIVDIKTFKKINHLLEGTNVHSLKINNEMVFASSQKGVHIFDRKENVLLEEKILNTPIYDIDINETEGNIYLTYKKNEGYGAVISYLSDGKVNLKENIPVLKNVNNTNPALSKTAWEANAGQFVLQNDKYIFVAMSEKSFASCGVVQIFDKASGMLITTLSEATSNANRYRPIRNMHLYNDVLYVTWGNGWNKGDSGAFNLNGVMSPIKVYDVSNVTADLTGKTIFTGGQVASSHAPYILGNISYLDSENGLLYISEVMRKDYGERYYYIYNTSEVEKALAGESVAYNRKRFKTGNLSMNTAKFLVKDGYLFEVLQNKGGLLDYNCDTTLVDSGGNAINNTVRVYDLNKVTLDTTNQSVANCLIGTYTTSTSGDKAIRDIEVIGDYLYVSTSQGVEVVALLDAKMSDVSVTLTAEAILTDAGGAMDLEAKGQYLYAAYAGEQLYANASQSGEGAVVLYNANGKETSEKARQTIKYGVCDVLADSDNYDIYMLSDSVNPPCLTVYEYDEKSLMFGAEKTVDLKNFRSMFLETKKSYKTGKGEKYTFVASGESEENIEKIYVFNSADTVVSEITSAGQISDFYVGSDYFYTYDGKNVSVYKIPTANKELSACLVVTFEAEGEIESLYETEGNIYVATTNGLHIYDIKTVTADGITKLNSVYDSKIIALCKNGNYVCGVKEDGIFIYDTKNYTQDAFCEYKDANFTDITASQNDIFAVAEDGSVLSFSANEGIVIDYNVNVVEPTDKKRSDIDIIKGFPNINFSDRVYSGHNKVEANEKYVVTAGTNEVKVYDSRLNEIKSISASSIQGISLNENLLTVADASSVILHDLLNDTSSEIATLSGSGLIYAEESGIWVYDKKIYEITHYSYSGNEISKITDCPQDLTKIYYEGGYLYLVSGDTVRLYGEIEEGTQTAAENLYKAMFDTVQKITALEAIENYLYVSTNGGNAPSNVLYVYKLDNAKIGSDASPSQYSSYSTMRSEQGGGKITDFERCGNFLVADAVDAGEIQVINIKEREKPYLESYIKKGVNDSYSFSDIAIGGDKVYAIAQNGGLCIYDYKSVDISDICFVSEGVKTYTPQGEKVSAQVSIYNESGSTLNGKLILALYGGENKNELENLIITDVIAPNGENTEVLTEEIEIGTSGEYEIKAMLFDELTSLKPLCEMAKSFDAQGETVIYVDAAAETSGNGTKDAPFKTIEEAKEEVKRINKAMSGNITVEIAGGRYELTNPLVFDESDSGYNGYNVIYKAKEGETPVVSGGKVIEGWTLYDEQKGIYMAPSNGINTRQLYVNGKSAQRARSKGGLTNAKGDGGVLGIYCYDDFICDYENIKDLELVFIGTFLSKRIGVDNAYKMDSSGKTLLVLNRPFWQYPSGYNSYILPSYYENALELLDEENEFYIDTEKEVIYYKPKDGEDIYSSFVVAPVLEELMVIEGSEFNKRAANLKFSGIEFTDTTWMGPTEDGGFYPTQAGQFVLPLKDNTYLNSNLTTNAITMNKAENITVSDCILKNLGGNAMRITKSCDVTVLGNKIYDVSAGGIYAGEIEKSEANPKDERKLTHHIIIENNYMKDIATEYYSSVAIATGTVQNTKISHNEIVNTPYTAIHLGWGWDSLPKRNIVGLEVSNNHIVNSVTLLGDGGAIYTTGYTLADSKLNPNLITENYIEKVNGNSVFAGAAIYLDTGSSGYLISKNVMDLTQSEGAWIPQWSVGNSTNIFDGNYSTTSNGVSIATNTTVNVKAQWDDDALAICENAGLTEDYLHLLD